MEEVDTSTFRGALLVSLTGVSDDESENATSSVEIQCYYAPYINASANDWGSSIIDATLHQTTLGANLDPYNEELNPRDVKFEREEEYFSTNHAVMRSSIAYLILDVSTSRAGKLSIKIIGRILLDSLERHYLISNSRHTYTVGPTTIPLNVVVCARIPHIPMEDGQC